MIQLAGLSPMQRDMAEALWAMQSVEQIMNFRNTLPRRQQQICDTVLYLLIAEGIDEQITDLEHCEQARSVIDGIR